MIVYADTSFLLAERIEQDANHKAALNVWHVAAAWCFGANRFVTFDERQAELAEDAGLVLA